LRLIAHGCRIEVAFDDQRVLDLGDETFNRGRIGFWTKADAMAYFDDLRLHMRPDSSAWRPPRHLITANGR
jgi:hypothetical protein